MLMLFMKVLPWQSRCHCLWLMTGNLHIEHQGPSLGPASALSRPPVPAHVWSHLLISLHTPSHFHKMSNSIQPQLYSNRQHTESGINWILHIIYTYIF